MTALAGGEGQGDCGETCHPQYGESPVFSVIEHPLLMKYVIFLGEKSKHQN
jgi:hypothetical protein